MTNFVDKNGNTLVIDRPNGPGKEFGATMYIIGRSSAGNRMFHLTEQHCRDIRRVLEGLLDWDNSERMKP